MTNWSNVTKNSTNWSGVSKNSTNYSGITKNPTHFRKFGTSAGVILLQTGDTLLYQNGEDSALQ